MSELVFDQKIDLPYVYTAGRVQREALTGLKEGRLIASEGDGYVAAPAAPFGPAGTHLRDTRELPVEGVLEAVTVAHHRPGSPCFGLIRIDGASHPMLHRLDGPLPAGARVRGVWRDERAGLITDIDHFTAAS